MHQSYPLLKWWCLQATGQTRILLSSFCSSATAMPSALALTNAALACSSRLSMLLHRSLSLYIPPRASPFTSSSNGAAAVHCQGLSHPQPILSCLLSKHQHPFLLSLLTLIFHLLHSRTILCFTLCSIMGLRTTIWSANYIRGLNPACFSLCCKSICFFIHSKMMLHMIFHALRVI